MQPKHARSLAAALLFCLVAGAVTWAQSQNQPSLGDVARHKSAAKAKRVVTNDEIPPSPAANDLPNFPGGASKTSTTSSAPGAVQPAAKDAKLESASEPQTKLRQLMTENESLVKIIKNLEDKVAATADEQRKSTLNEVIKHARESLQENQQQIDKLKADGVTAANQPAANPSAPPSAPPK